MDENKIVYSTKTGYNKSVLQQASEVIVEGYRKQAKDEINPILQNITGNGTNNIVHISVFLRYWYPKIKAFIEEGRDLIAEENPNNSIFAAWNLAAGSCSAGLKVVDNVPGPNEALGVIVETPGIMVPKRFNKSVIDMNLEAIGSHMYNYVGDSFRMAQQTNMVANEIHGFIKNDDNTDEAISDRERFKKEWLEVLDKIENYSSGGFKPTVEDKEVVKDKEIKQEQKIDDSYLDF